MTMSKFAFSLEMKRQRYRGMEQLGRGFLVVTFAAQELTEWWEEACQRSQCCKSPQRKKWMCVGARLESFLVGGVEARCQRRLGDKSIDCAGLSQKSKIPSAFSLGFP